MQVPGPSQQCQIRSLWGPGACVCHTPLRWFIGTHTKDHWPGEGQSHVEMLARVPAGWRGGRWGPLRPPTLFLGFVLHYERSGLRIIMSQARKGLQGHVATGFFRDLIFFHLFLEGKSCDEGRSFLIDALDSPATLAYRSIIQSKCRYESCEFSWPWGQEVT